MMHRRTLATLLAISVLAVAQPYETASPAAAGLFESVDVPDAIATSAYGVGPTGDIVGDYADAQGKRHGFLLSRGTFRSIDVPGAIATIAFGINAAGDIVGDYTDTSGVHHGYLLRNGEFIAFDVPGSTGTFGMGISPSGAIVGEYKLGEPFGTPAHAFLMADGEFTTLIPPGSVGRIAWGTNARGDSVGLFIDEFGVGHGWRRDRQGNYDTLDVPGAIFTNGRGVNAAGEVVGLYRGSDLRNHGFVLSHGEYTSFDFPDAGFTRGLGIKRPRRRRGRLQRRAGEAARLPVAARALTGRPAEAGCIAQGRGASPASSSPEQVGPAAAGDRLAARGPARWPHCGRVGRRRSHREGRWEWHRSWSSL